MGCERDLHGKISGLDNLGVRLLMAVGNKRGVLGPQWGKVDI